MTTEPPMPEHDKLHEAKERDATQTVGEFLDWLGHEKGIHLMRRGPMDHLESCSIVPGDLGCGGRGWVWRDAEGGTAKFNSGECWVGMPDGPPVNDTRMMMCSRCGGTGEVAVAVERWVGVESNQRLMYEFFEVDGDKLEEEKRALLEVYRAL